MLRILIVLTLLVTLAHAQRAPDMATLDRADGITKVGFDLGFSSLNPPPYDAALRFELWGQYVTKIGLGFYGALPVASSFGGKGTPRPPERDSRTSLEDGELGLVYVISGPWSGIVFRGGVGLPIATGGEDPAATRFLAAAPRLTDLALATGDWYARLSISPLFYGHHLFLRADVGLDVDLSGNDYHFLRLNIGGGADLGLVALSLELVNSITFGESMRADERVFDTLAFTARFITTHFQPFLSVGAPLDGDRRAAINFFIAAGLTVAI